MNVLAFVGALGRAFVSWGLGGTGEGSPPQPIVVTVPTSAEPLIAVSIPAPEPYLTITTQGPMGRIHIGDTAVLEGITFRDRDGALVDPATITARVKPRGGAVFELVYGTTTNLGDEDAFIRRSLGTYALQIAITADRGEGVYDVSIVATGSRAAEPMTFTVQHREV